MASPGALMRNEVLLTALSRKLKETCRAHDEPSDVNDVMSNWYRRKIQLSAVEEACEDYELSALHHSQDSEMSQLMDDLKERLVHAEVEQLLQPSSISSQNPILGVSSPKRPDLKNKATSAKLQNILDEKIRKKLLTISKFYQPSPPGAGENLVNAKAKQLSAIVARDKQIVVDNKTKIEKLQIHRLQQIRELHQVHMRNLELLVNLLGKYKLQLLLDCDRKSCHYIAAKSEAFSAKLGLIEAELLADSYKPELVAELKSIRSQLDLKLADTREKLEKAEHAYRSCLSAGTEFHKIAKDYSQLKKDIESRQWALTELKTARTHHSS